jgi:hypothetical protein
VKVERTLRHEIEPAEVFRMICTPAFQEQKCQEAGALKWSVAVDETPDGGAVVRTTRRMPTHDFPVLLRKFVPHGVTSTETITWGPADAEGGRTAELHVAIHGVPAKMAGTVRLAADGTGTTIVVDADFVAHIPVVKRKIEAASVPIILQVIDAEVQTGLTWAAGVR